MLRLLERSTIYMNKANTMRALCLLVLGSICSAATAQQREAPFGFVWGQTLDEIEKITGSEANLELLWGRVHNLDTKSAPSTPPDTNHISLAVDPELGLGRVIWFSTTIQSDAYGTTGKENYQKYKALLSKKYGKPETSGEIIGKKLWDEADEFYQCLAYDGCGMYISIWEAEDGFSVMLQLRGLSRGTGFIYIVYEGPNWDDIVDEVNNAAAEAEEDSF